MDFPEGVPPPEADEGFVYGDIVAVRLRPDIVGMVVGDSDFGRRVAVRLTASLNVVDFFDIELMHHVPGEDPDPAEADPINFTDRTTDLAQRRTAGRA